jgi:type II secretion system protein H
MISPTTGFSNNRDRGFTLLELLLVVTLIAVMAGIVFPRVSRSTRSLGLREEADTLAEFVRFGRTEAVRRGVQTRLRISKSNGAYWLDVQDESASTVEQFTNFEDPFLDSEKPLPSGISMRAIAGEEHRITLDSIAFTPDGIGEPTRIELSGNDERPVYIELGSWYDDVKVADASLASAGGE